MLPMNWGCSKKASFERLLIFHELVFLLCPRCMLRQYSLENSPNQSIGDQPRSARGTRRSIALRSRKRTGASGAPQRLDHLIAKASPLGE